VCDALAQDLAEMIETAGFVALQESTAEKAPNWVIVTAVVCLLGKVP